MQNPTVAILLATHNSEKYLSCQIDSLINQTYGNIKIVISDDLSSDKTEEIIEDYIKKDLRISTVKSKKRLGSAQANFMFLLQNAPKADYYMFCDHDDRWVKDKVERTLNKMLDGDTSLPRLVHSDLFVSDSSLNVIANSMFEMQKLPKEQNLAQSLVQNGVTGCTVMINNALRNIMLKKQDCENMIMHDWYLNILAHIFGTVDFVNRPLIFYRQHGNNEVGAKDVRSPKYIASRAVNLRKNKHMLIYTYMQVKDIIDIYGDILPKNSEVIRIYADFIKYGKIKKIFLSFKYGLLKNTFVRRIGQLLFM